MTKEQILDWLDKNAPGFTQKDFELLKKFHEEATKELQEEKCNLANKILDNWCRNKDDYCPHLKALEKQISDMSDVINDLVHLGTFDENTDEEYVNYQVHEALKKAEKYLPK